MMNYNTTKAYAQLAAESDETEPFRRRLVASINANPARRDALAAAHARIRDTPQRSKDSDVLGFLALFVIVRPTGDERKGSWDFQHQQRFYFSLSANDQYGHAEPLTLSTRGGEG